jgi:hypothetical protein
MLKTPAGMLLAVALLALFGVYGLWTAWYERSWWSIALALTVAVVAFVACVGAALLKAWSRYLVYLLTAAAMGAWAYSIRAGIEAGFFSLYSPQQIVVSLLPEALLILLACFCSYTCATFGSGHEKHRFDGFAVDALPRCDRLRGCR